MHIIIVCSFRINWVYLNCKCHFVHWVGGLVDGHWNPISLLCICSEYVTTAFTSAWEWLRSWFKKNVPHNMFVEGIIGERDVVYRQAVSRSTYRSCSMKHQLRHPSQVITGISCLQLDKDLQSPEVEISKGGINCNNVTICLTPVQEGKWGCNITICATPQK
jgi:hypothetical protein